MVPLALAARVRSRIWAWTLAKELDGRDQGDAPASPASALSGPVSAPGARPGEAPLSLSSPAAAKQARYLGAEPGNDQGSAELGPTRHHGHGQAMGGPSTGAGRQASAPQQINRTHSRFYRDLW